MHNKIISIQLLASGDFLKHAKWMSSYTRPERLPLPYILGAVHRVSVTN